MPTEYPLAFKRKVIQRYEKGEAIKNLSQELSIAQSTIYHWRKLYCSIQTPQRTYTPKEFDVTSRRLEKLEHEMEIIRVAGYLDEIPLQRKLQTLEAMYLTADFPYSVHELCEALDVARGTFYNHIFRRADRSEREKEQEELMIKVQQIFDDSQQRFGAEKIRMILAQSGVHVSAKRISAIMQELGLRSIRTNAKKQYKKRQQYQKQNLLQESLPQTIPIKYGSATLHTSRSAAIGYISVSSLICFLVRSLDTGCLAMPAPTWSPRHFGIHIKSVVDLKI